MRFEIDLESGHMSGNVADEDRYGSRVVNIAAARSALELVTERLDYCYRNNIALKSITYDDGRLIEK